MAARAARAAEPPPDIPRWLKTLPLAPEYRPTLEEFRDPIAYVLQIENEASEYGICKIVPPIPPAPKKTVISNLNRSLASSIPTSNPKSAPTFTTIEQQIGFGNRTPRAAQNPKWKIGERCSVRQFEAKARRFENSYMKGIGKKRLSPLEIENLFWKAIVDDEAFAVECASDIPGSAFEPMEGKNLRGAGKGATVGESEWNMGGISRAEGSLLRFMKEEIPGVNSPVLNLSMMFSWFAWHAEDHDLHSLNYLHIGAAKTWYGVPGEAAVAFEEVVGAHGYGGDVNPLVTFAIIGEKTTVMSPEALIDAGIPCCRLVQNAGEFVVTFPRAYHSGFSHGFNCCEATNIATPKWLMVAKEAAIRRASINRPPVVSHFQLLYALALSLCSRVPKSINTKPRSFRVKHKEKIEGETIVKELFVLNVMQNNDLLHVLLEQGSSCVLLHQNFLDGSECSNSPARTKTKTKPKLSIGLCSLDGEIEASKGSLSNDTIQDLVRPLTRFYSVRKRSSFVSEGDKPPSSVKHDQFGDAELCSLSSERQDMISEKESTSNGCGLSGRELFTCVACGISSSACSAVIQPREAAAQYLMSAEFSFFNDWLVGSGALDDRLADGHRNGNVSEPNTCSDLADKTNLDDLYEVHVRPSSYQVLDRRVEVPSEAEAQRNISSLDLLAVAYGNSSDSDEDPVGAQIPTSTDENEIRDSSLLQKQNERYRYAHGVVSSQSKFSYDNSTSNGFEQDGIHKEAGNMYHTSFRLGCGNAVPFQIYKHTSASFRDQEGGSTYVSTRSKESYKSEMENLVLWESKSLKISCRDRIATPGKVIDQSVKGRSGEMKSERAACDSAELSNCTHEISKCAPASFSETNKHSNVGKPMKNTDMLVKQLSEGYSSKNHIFCLEHAVEVEKQLQSIGGVHVLVLCHPDYPKVVAGAKSFAEELGIDYLWKDVPFREATIADQERIQSALDSEEARPRNEDWAVKLGISLSYFARLSHSPLYSKKMPFNSVIYKAFGCSSPARSSMKSKVSSKRLGKRNKPSVVGRWCGKVWMSNQVHPYLAQRGTNEEEPSANVDSQAIPEAKAEKKRHSNCIYEQTPDPEQNILPNADTCSARKAGKKRKTVSTKGASKKPKYLQLDSSNEGVKDSPKSTSPKQLQRTLRSRLPKREMGQRCDYKAKNNLQNDSKAKEECAGGPIGRLRRSSNPPQEDKPKSVSLNQCRKKDNKKVSSGCKEMPSNNEMKYQCNMDGCTMGFRLKQELVLHKSNICPVKGCGKKFFAHKYLVQHKRVHVDDRPLKCPWKGCKMTFKWPWARTEHIRVHTGVRPYVCREPGCGQTFRFVSDFSRHKRKTGHSGKKKGKGRG